jgi:uncharacterized membrane protein
MLHRYPPYFDSPQFCNYHNLLFDAYGYFDSTYTLYGFVVPFLLSLIIALRLHKNITKLPLIALFMATALSYLSSYTGGAGLHVFPVSVFVVAALVWFAKSRLPLLTVAALSYAFGFLSVLPSDIINSLINIRGGAWQTFYYGIGGGGFHDVLFINPLLCVFAVLLTSAGSALAEYSRNKHVSLQLDIDNG